MPDVFANLTIPPPPPLERVPGVTLPDDPPVVAPSGETLSPQTVLIAAGATHGWLLGPGRWLLANRARVAPWLARYALGGDDTQRHDARRGLALLLRHTDGVLERQSLEMLGASPEQIDRVLWPDADWQDSYSVAPIRPSRTWKLLDPVPLRDGTSASKEVVAVLLGVLRTGWPVQHPILAPVHAHVTPEALGALLENAWREWSMTHTAATDWVMEARLRHRGRDGAWELLEAARGWANTTEFKVGKAAEKALGIVARYGGPEALGPLAEIVARPPNRYIKAPAREAFEALKARLGDGAEDALDRGVPTLGLDGPLLFDFGPRRFRARLGPDLGWEVRDDENVLLADLPAPKRTDDAALASAAIARWRAFKQDAKTVLLVQRARLEEAMLTDRQYAAAHFQTSVAGNPLLRLLVAGLVWRQGDHTFRVAEDGTFADENDDAYVLGDAPVHLPHPLHIADAPGARWAAVLADYAIAPAVSQLDRETFADAPAGGWTITSGALLGLARAGWVMPRDEAVFDSMSRRMGGAQATVHLEPGIERWDVKPDAPQRVSTPRWRGAPTAVMRSEVVRELTRVRAT